MVFAEGNGQLEYEQKHVYAGSERIEQFTDKGNWERTLYVHEDVMGNTRYYTKANGQSFAELAYDAWGMPESPNKLLNNDHGNYVSATFTGHIYDTTLDIYFAEARFYDADNRTWLAADPVKDGGNWYQYCNSNPTTYWDPTGLWGIVTGTKQAKMSGSEHSDILGNIDWDRVGIGVLKGASAVMVLAIGITAVVATGGAALPAVLGLLGGTVTTGTAIVTVGTFAAGAAAVTFGFSDVLEASQDLGYGVAGSSKASFNPLRDTMFTGNENLYYNLEMLATLFASAGTATFRSFNMESEINKSKMAGFGTGSAFEGGTSTKITSNLGNEIDITPSSNHSTVPKNSSPNGTPNSSVDILDDAGNVVRRRWYDSNGNAYRDVDMTNHGNPKKHPEYPHEHTWDWSSGNPKRSK